VEADFFFLVGFSFLAVFTAFCPFSDRPCDLTRLVIFPRGWRCALIHSKTLISAFSLGLLQYGGKSVVNPISCLAYHGVGRFAGFFLPGEAAPPERNEFVGCISWHLAFVFNVVFTPPDRLYGFVPEER